MKTRVWLGSLAEASQAQAIRETGPHACMSWLTKSSKALRSQLIKGVPKSTARLIVYELPSTQDDLQMKLRFRELIGHWDYL